jgi:phosphate:Na+ symporter
MEIVRMGRHAQAMVRQSAPAVLGGSRRDLERLRGMDDEIDILHRAIVHYLGRISRQELSPAQTEALHDYLNIASLYESMGDIVETDLVHVGEERLRRNVQVSSETQEMMKSLADKVDWAIDAGVKAVDVGDRSLAQEIVEAKEVVNALADQISDRLIQRLVAEDPHRTSTFRVETQLIEHLKRIYYFSKRVAKLVFEADVLDPERGETVKAA